MGLEFVSGAWEGEGSGVCIASWKVEAQVDKFGIPE